jgi:hypothetical protein
LSLTSNFGTKRCFLSSLRISRSAARVSRRRWTRMSRTSPSWSTARQRYIRLPAIRTTISSRCQRCSAEGDALAAAERTELQHPSPHRFIGDVEPSCGQQFLDIAVAQGEAEIEPDRVLDDLGRGAMAAAAELSHADILPDALLAPDLVCVTMPVASLRSPEEPIRNR